MSVLVAVKHVVNAVAQNCKVLSRPSKCVLILGQKYQIYGNYVFTRVCNYPFLHQVRFKLEEVPIWMGNLCLNVSSASSHDATSEVKENLRPKTLCESY